MVSKIRLGLTVFCVGVTLNMSIAGNLTPGSLNPVNIETKTGPAPYELVKDNHAAAVIIIPSAKEDHRYSQVSYVGIQKEYAAFYQRPVAAIAAGELQKYIELATGAKLPILKADQPIPSEVKLILVGDSEVSRQFGISNRDLRAEGFKIESFSRGIAIVGAPLPELDKRGSGYDGLFGSLFGVYDFLERFVGIRFYYPGEDGTIVPKLNNLTIPPIVYSDYPRYAKRTMYGCTNGHFDGHTPDCTIHMLRFRCGGHGLLGSERSWCHTPYDLTRCPGVPKAEYRDNAVPPPMPCYGNPQTANEFMQSIENIYTRKGDLNAWRTPRGLFIPNPHVVPFSPPDHPMLCKCSYCRNLIDWKAPFHEQASRLYGNFIKDMAGRIKTKYPDKTFYILPYYNYTSPSKGLVLPNNVFAQVCLMYGHSLYHDPKIRRQIIEWVNDWTRITGKKIHIYTYPMWPSVRSPFPYQYYNNVKNFMSEISPSVDGMFLDSLTSWNKEFPTMYCHFRLMWNPAFNVKAAIREQNDLLYGQAAVYMQKLMDGITGVWESRSTVNLPSAYDIGPYHAGTISKKVLYNRVIQPKMVAAWEKLLKEAEQSVPRDSVYRRRIDFFGHPLKLFFLDYNFYKRKFNPETATVIRCRKMPDLNGKFDDSAWRKAPEYHFVNALLSLNRKPAAMTTVKMMFDDHGLRLGFSMEEPNLSQAVITKPVSAGNSIELLLEFQPGRIYRFTVDSNGNIDDSFQGKAPRRRVGAPSWKVVNGDGKWNFDIYIPFATLDADMKFSAYSPWRGNFCRNRVISGKTAEYSRWQTCFSKSHLDNKAFGKLKFENYFR